MKSAVATQIPVRSISGVRLVEHRPLIAAIQITVRNEIRFPFRNRETDAGETDRLQHGLANVFLVGTLRDDFYYCGKKTVPGVRVMKLLAWFAAQPRLQDPRDDLISRNRIKVSAEVALKTRAVLEEMTDRYRALVFGGLAEEARDRVIETELAVAREFEDGG